MRILLVKPNMGLVNDRPYDDRGRMEPLTLAVLAGYTPPEHEVCLCYDRLEPVPYSEPWDLVGINTEVYTARRAYEIADRFRAAGVPVVIGGCHATMAAEEAAAHADAVALGDTDATTWQAIIGDAQRRALEPVYEPGPAGSAIVGYQPRREIGKGKSYLRIALTQLGRGCPNTCEYCTTGTLYRGHRATRDPRQVVQELAEDGRRLVFFVDDNFIADRAAVMVLLRELVPLKLRWSAQASLDFAADPELMELMVASGCSGLVVGFESLDPRNLTAMNKTSNLAFGHYDEVVERIRAAGLMLWAAFLLGYDHETPESIRETVDWALSKRFAFSAFNILMPYPGTPIYARMAAEGRLLFDGRWWLHDDYRFGDAAFRPRLMAPEQLSQLALEARLRHSSLYQIARRASDRKTNCKNLSSLLTYAAYNPLFRNEMLKKHGMVLGYRGRERREPGERKIPGGRAALALDGLRRTLGRGTW
jgi:radical SAM superfamily enzyme YgiQ (UPF0313 family)